MEKINLMRILLTIMLMIVFSVLWFPTANADFGWEQVVGDGAGSSNGFDDADNVSALSMAIFGSYFYIGTGNGTDSCEMWRSSNGTIWNQVNMHNQHHVQQI